MFPEQFKKRRLALSVSLALGTATFMTACNPVQDTSKFVKETFNSDDPCSNNARNIGAVVGGVAGLLIGRNNSDSAAMIALASAAGAGIGALIGSDIDNRRCELHKISQKYKVPIQAEAITPEEIGLESDKGAKNDKATPVGLKVTLQDVGNQFESGSDKLTPIAREYFSDIAKTYSVASANAKDPKERQQQLDLIKQKQILIIGHTDDTGSSNFNAELAEKRAKVVAELFKANGVPLENLHFQGAGETQPIADNRTEDGRSKNRRAEIVELSNRQELVSYLEQRKPVIAYYRNIITPKVIASNQAKLEATTNSKKQSTVKPPQREEAVTPSVQTVLDKGINSKWNFGGEPLQQASANVNVGELVPAKDKLAWIPFISTATASEQDSVYASSCSVDRPRITRGVKSLSTGKELEYTTANFLPGMNNTAWMGDVGQHRVGLAGLAVARDGAAPVKNPDVLIYQQTNNSSPLLAKLKTEANAYQGKNGILYRVFISDSQNTPVTCIDLVLPNQAPFNASSGYLIHQNGSQTYATSFKPHKI